MGASPPPSEMTYIVSSGALNSTHSLTHPKKYSVTQLQLGNWKLWTEVRLYVRESCSRCFVAFVSRLTFLLFCAVMRRNKDEYKAESLSAFGWPTRKQQIRFILRILQNWWVEHQTRSIPPIRPKNSPDLHQSQEQPPAKLGWTCPPQSPATYVAYLGYFKGGDCGNQTRTEGFGAYRRILCICELGRGHLGCGQQREPK